MSDSIIKVENLSKSYVISHQSAERYTALRDVFSNGVKQLPQLFKAKKNEQKKEEFFALNDVNFEIKRGDRVGIIGRNGAGKSTLLKILSRITEPTTGRIHIKGRVASLLEVGTGFHPELTGRENIFLNGAILGMSRSEIKKKFDEIVDFAEVEKFLDTPVKRYSSGMYVRLAFAVAAHLDPEVLIIDEVLAVGDAQFQKKCLGKMEDVSKQSGRTVLFVSHQLTAIQNLCNKGIVLNKGQLQFEGNIGPAALNYLNEFSSSKYLEKWDFNKAPGNEFSKLLKAEVRPLEINPGNLIKVGDSFEFEFIFYYIGDKKSNLDITFHLMDEMGHLVYVGSSAFDLESRMFDKGEIKATCRIPPSIMHEGTYKINRLLLIKDRGTILFEKKDLLQFEIIDTGNENFGWMSGKEGIVKPKLLWNFN